MRSHFRWIAAIAPALLLILTATPAMASIGNIKSALLRPGDAPSGFSHPHVAMYTRFSEKMEVRTLAAGSQTMRSCEVPRSFARQGWREGFIQAFDSTRSQTTLQMCVSLFKTARGAHAAYVYRTERQLKLLIKLGEMKQLATTQIGDESMTVGGGDLCKCGGMTAARTYEIVFRRDNALVDLAYQGASSFTQVGFERLAVRINSNLH